MDIFYKFDNDDLFDIFHFALKNNFLVFVDIKDDNYKRVPCSEYTPEEMIDILTEDKKAHNVVILRRDPYFIMCDDVEYGEIGGSTMDRERDIFLFIFVKFGILLDIVKKFKLKEL
jgi:hypothetical protein